jgi:DNA-directed RNA polymerase alpha subunit
VNFEQMTIAQKMRFWPHPDADASFTGASINRLAIRSRAFQALRNAGLVTVGEISSFLAAGAGGVPNFGRRSADEVRRAIDTLRHSW